MRVLLFLTGLLVMGMGTLSSRLYINERRRAKAKANAAKKLGNAKRKTKAVKPATKARTGKAKAKPKAISKTAQRAKNRR